MKKQFKALSLLMSLLMVFPVISGCQQQQTASTAASDSKEPVTITIWHEAEPGIIKPLQAELNKLAPNITVKFERKDKMNEALKLVGNDPKSAPDMYMMAHDKTGTFAEMGIISPITDFVKKDEMKDLLPLTVKGGTYKDKQYQLPVYFETQMLIYNKKLIQNVPTTTDDWLKYMKDNTKDGNYALVEQHSTAYYSAAWMHAFGASIISNDAKPGLNSEAMKKAVDYHKQFAALEPADGEYNTVTTMFTSGKAAAIIQGPWFIPSVKKAGIDYGVAPMPTVSSTGKTLQPYAGVQGFYVLKNAGSSKKAAITKVLQQLLKPEVGIFLADAADSAPANSKAYEDSTVKENGDLMNMKKTAESAVPMQNIPEMDVMWGVTETALSSINKNNADISKTLDDAQKKALEGISNMK